MKHQRVELAHQGKHYQVLIWEHGPIQIAVLGGKVPYRGRMKAWWKSVLEREPLHAEIAALAQAQIAQQ